MPPLLASWYLVSSVYLLRWLSCLLYCSVKRLCLMNRPDCAERWQVSLAKWRWAIYGSVSTSVPHSDSWIKVSICSSLSRCWKTSHLFTCFVLCCLTLGLHACLVLMLWKGFRFSDLFIFFLLFIYFPSGNIEASTFNVSERTWN